VLEFKPKHTIGLSKKFLKDKESLGGLILEGMKTTGGTDIDWLIERRGGFIIMETKNFNRDHISIKMGQMIAFEQLHKKLNSDGRCHFLIIGYDDIDYKNPDSIIRYFDMQDWKNKKIPYVIDSKYKQFKVNRKEMKSVTLKEYRQLMEKYWNEFDNS